MKDLPKGLAAPAIRALDSKAIHDLAALSKFSEREIAELHGIGPNALKKLKQALRERGMTFRP